MIRSKPYMHDERPMESLDAVAFCLKHRWSVNATAVAAGLDSNGCELMVFDLRHERAAHWMKHHEPESRDHFRGAKS